MIVILFENCSVALLGLRPHFKAIVTISKPFKAIVTIHMTTQRLIKKVMIAISN